MIAANAAEETNSGVPYWRTIKNNGELNEKYPGGAERQKELLEKEGHIIVKRGRKFYLPNLEERLLRDDC
jgi:alkylated DNA nucleotide flippase Atl1